MITGCKENIEEARRRIEEIAESARQNFPFTHFLCFPLYESDLEGKVKEFKERVLKECSGVGFSPNSCFIFLFYSQ